MDTDAMLQPDPALLPDDPAVLKQLVVQLLEELQKAHARLERQELASHVIHTDDTSVKVRDAWRKLKYTGRFWPYVGDALHSLTVFDYTTNHQRAGPAAFLKDYRGYLQADAFNGYDGIYLESQGRIVEVACWARAGGSSTSAGGWTRPAWRRRWPGSASSTRSRRICAALPGRVGGAHVRQSAPGGSPPSGRSVLGRC